MTRHRAGWAVLAGRPNVGKSTLLNALCGFPLAIVTPKAQTTRHRIVGVMHRPDAQVVWLDTPGLHVPKDELGRRMVAGAGAAAREADVLVFVASAIASPGRHVGPTEAERKMLDRLGGRVPAVLALNKVDLVRPKEKLLPMLGAWAAAFPFVSLVPLSALRSDGLDRLVDEVVARLPEHPPYWGPDTLTDRPERFLAAELVREAATLRLEDELPRSLAVTIDRFEEGERLHRIAATIHVERESQKRIVVGHRGTCIKRIGIEARRAVERTLGRRVHLELFVRVTRGWTSDGRLLDELGIERR